MQGEFIEDTIISVLNQTYQNIEYIILDSCSSDDTDDIVKKYICRPNLIYVREKDNGQAHAINKGLELCKGEIVCWLNSDDIFFNNGVITKIVEIFNSGPTIDMITGDGYFCDPKLNLVSPITVTDIRHMSLEYMKGFDVILQPSTFWKKNGFRLDEKLNYAFDWKYFMEFFQAKKSIYYCREYLSCYRVHEAGKTKTDTAIRKREILELVIQFESSKFNIAWNYVILLLYLLSEKLHAPFFKKLARHANEHVSNMSCKKIYSC